ncbi:MAG: class I SAM-dependent methyltransferase [Candidatus Acidulodesulfobacterium acidiphilum]|uniref:Class I SAM-dependent methyltransferase n=1 Tax=Candidatus Acidulodesulfobacterium acidiphilum TaxID=2597224 RepID=A0A520XC94_9DELT|nr:MAG: class I SAM-dependent methyltransferase [Candidatus Acidulodesulfobacterium acidiphilum]
MDNLDNIANDSLVEQKAIDEHLNIIHAIRCTMVRYLLPKGEIILDLGGANCQLYKMGYTYRFKRLILIDLSPEERLFYKEIVIDNECQLGEVIVQYSDMTNLAGIEDSSVDFVWSGQSIEHVPLDLGEHMCKEVFRVLRSGGSFCLDTPNRLITQIHTRSVGGGFVHPEHCIEYYPQQLMTILENTGFIISEALGLCEMPLTISTDKFHYTDFVFGRHFTNEVSNGYIQYYHCIKP